MQKNTHRNAVLAATLLTILAGQAQAQITSTFDNDDEGWSFLNDARLFTWTNDIGNPPGAIRATDVGDGRIWYFAASSAYVGDLSSYYGGTLSWDVRGIQGNQTSISGRADVMLTGAGLELGIDLGVVPSTSQWTSWSAVLDASQDWRIISSLGNGTLSATPASQAQIQAVLGNLTGLYIRGEYTNGADSAALDNVLLIPTPGTLALLGVAGMGLRRRR